jgi:hypothetical protein
VRPDEVVIAAKQLKVIFETRLPSRVTSRSPAKIRRALSDREIQPFDKGRVQFRGVLGVAQRLFQAPWCADHRSSLDLDNAIIPARLDDLAIETRWAEDATDNSMVKLESVRGDQRETFETHSAGYISEKGESVPVAPSSDDGRWPKPRPDIDRDENPDRLVLAANNCAELICLKFRNGESYYFFIVEPTTRGGCLFEPAIDSIPADSLYSSDCGLIQTFDAESSNLIKCRTTVLESIVGFTHVQAEGLPANPATVSTALSSVSLVEAVADDVSNSGYSGMRASLV